VNCDIILGAGTIATKILATSTNGINYEVAGLVFLRRLKRVQLKREMTVGSLIMNRLKLETNPIVFESHLEVSNGWKNCRQHIIVNYKDANGLDQTDTVAYTSDLSNYLPIGGATITNDDF
jgi:hypothetical protein